jgi:phenylacetate-coenzyme A ligase PaaK-like adenylate-forming protein
MQRSSLLERIKTVKDQDFTALTLDIFRYQAENNPVYRKFLDLLGIKQAQIQRIEDIPFLPIELFKKYELQSGEWTAQQIFTSSGTTGANTSQHFVRDSQWYLENARRGFEYFYGPLKDYIVLALLPAYLERKGSSLILMAQDFIEQSRSALGGFYLYNQKELIHHLQQILQKESSAKVLLLGVSFALLDLAEAYPLDLQNVIIMETGGMKGRREEITRTELHQLLKTAFQQQSIHSEYGMTELFSQAYSQGSGLFFPAPTMRVFSREITDPLQLQDFQRTGALNIIDLANLDTISFIATEDLGKVYADGSFEILGRLDASDVRGCNLMVI